MKQKTYWKDLGQSIWTSKGRFLSLLLLMMIGTLALVGLKVTAPNMEQTAQAYLDQHQTMDLALMSPFGLDQEDVSLLQSLEGAEVEMGYWTDRTLSSSQKAIRIFSKPQQLSLYAVQEGRLPQEPDEIALAVSLKGAYSLGDSLSLTDLDKGGKLLRSNQFRVVGFVQSSEIWDQVTMGISSSGDGLLAAYGVVAESAFESEVYTIARLSYADLDDLSAFDPAYDRQLALHQQELEDLFAGNEQKRLTRIRSKAQEEIRSGQQAIQEGKETLAQGEDQLSKQLQEVDRGQGQVNQGQAALSANQISWNDQLLQLAQTKEELDQAKESLDRQAAQLDETAAFLAVTKADLDRASDQIGQAQSQLERDNAVLSQEGASLAAAQASWYQAQRELDVQIGNRLQLGETLSDHPDLLASQTQLDGQRADLDTALSTYQARQQDYQAGFAYLEDRQSAHAKGVADYLESLGHYQAGQSQYEAAYQAYQSDLASYEQGLDALFSGQDSLLASQEQLDREDERLQAIEDQLIQAQARLKEEKAQKEATFSQAEKDLAQAQAGLDSLQEPVYQVYTRTSLPGGEGYTTYKNATASIAAVGTVFPVVLYLVAAFVTFTTMTRFVDEERGQAGLLRALGYSKPAVLSKFMVYGLMAALLGSVIGIVAGHYLLSPMISQIITDQTVIGPANLSFYPLWAGLAIGLSCLSAVLPAYLVAAKELHQVPASLLQAKPPVEGASIWLERIDWLWSRLTFTQKVAARNIFRYKKRMMMTIFGVAGTVSLLVGGLGIRTSISGVVEEQFGQLVSYHLLVVEEGGAGQEERASLGNLLQSQAVAASHPIAYYSLTQKLDKEGQSLSVGLLVTEDPAYSDQIHLYRAGSQTRLQLDHQGAIFSENLARLYGLSLGDLFTIKLFGKEVELRVAAISKLYAGHSIYLTAPYFEEVTGQAYQPNAYLVQLADGSEGSVRAFASRLLEEEAVLFLLQNTSLVAMLETVAGSLQAVMLILVALSVLLGLVILYNLTTINLAERVRELSTIKVLGFHTREITLYIYRETILLSLVGVLLGLGGGVALHRLLLDLIGSTTIIFPARLTAQVYLLPLLLVGLILAGLGYFVHRKLDRLEMLEALKAAD